MVCLLPLFTLFPSDTASSVSLAGPDHVQEGAAISLTCETMESNPPSSLLWVVQGKEVAVGEVKVERTTRPSGGVPGWKGRARGREDESLVYTLE